MKQLTGQSFAGTGSRNLVSCKFKLRPPMTAKSIALPVGPTGYGVLRPPQTAESAILVSLREQLEHCQPWSVCAYTAVSNAKPALTTISASGARFPPCVLLAEDNSGVGLGKASKISGYFKVRICGAKA